MLPRVEIGVVGREDGDGQADNAGGDAPLGTSEAIHDGKQLQCPDWDEPEHPAKATAESAVVAVHLGTA